MSEKNLFNRFSKLRGLLNIDPNDKKGNLLLHFLSDHDNCRLDIRKCEEMSGSVNKYAEVNNNNWDVNANTGLIKNDPNPFILNTLFGTYAVAVANSWKETPVDSSVLKIVKALDTRTASINNVDTELFDLFRNNPRFADRIADLVDHLYELRITQNSRGAGVRVRLNEREKWSSVDKIEKRAPNSWPYQFTQPCGEDESPADSDMTQWQKAINKTIKDWKATKHICNIKYNDVKDESVLTFRGYKLCKASVREILERITLNDNLPLSGVLAGSTSSTPNIERVGNDWMIDGVVVGWNNLEDCCQAVGLDGKDDNVCTDYLTKCLQGSDIDQCKTYMEREDFWENMVASAKKIHPGILLKTLEKFGVRFNGHGNSTQVESIATWAARTRQEGKVTNIGPKLQAWLQVLADIYNSNVDVRNQNRSNAFEGTKWAEWGLAPKLVVVNGNVASTMGHMANIATIGTTGRPRILLGMVGNKKQVGGHPHNDDGDGPSQDSIDNVEATLGSLSHLLSSSKTSELVSVWDGLQTKLRGLGKTMAQNDHNAIDNLIKDFKVNEDKLHKSLVLADKYADLLSLGENDSKSVVNVDHFTDFVNKNVRQRAEKLERQAINLGSIFTTLQKTLSQQGGATIVQPTKYN